MKIMLLANHFNTGGITTYLLTLAKGHLGRGHEVLIASSGGECVAQAEAMGARHILVPGLAVKNALHPGLVAAGFRLARLIKQEHVDILHAHTRVTQCVAALAGGLSRRPYVATCHGFFKPHLGRILFPLWGSRAIAISNAVAAHLTRDLRVAPVKVAVVPTGVDCARFTPMEPLQRQVLRARFGVDMQTPLVGMVARLSDVKGHRYLIAAMQGLLRRMPQARCLIIGDGPMEAELKAQAQECGLGESIVFAAVNGVPEKLLPMFDVVAVPSVQEGLGLSAMEALACGIPVVASRVGGLPEVVKDGATGFLVPPQDPAALADAMHKLLADRILASDMGGRGREWIRERFAIDRMIDGILAVYQEALTAYA